MSGATLPGIAEAVEVVRACSRCQKSYPATSEHFGRRSGTQTHLLSSWCRSCMREHARRKQAARRADPIEVERVKAEKRRHAQSERGRARRRERSTVENSLRRSRLRSRPFEWNKDDWRACIRRWCGRCAWCGDRPPVLEQDHFVPLIDPTCPGTIPANMVPACGRCNRSKGARDPFTWAPVVARRIALHLACLAAAP